MIKQFILVLGAVFFVGLALKPIEWVMSSLGYPPNSNASWTAQTVVIMITIITYIWLKNKRESKEYEREIEKRLRVEREICERLEREAQAKVKK